MTNSRSLLRKESWARVHLRVVKINSYRCNQLEHSELMFIIHSKYYVFSISARCQHIDSTDSDEASKWRYTAASANCRHDKKCLNISDHLTCIDKKP
ncbi:unnamed protein product [Albugo candida]|uniref:Uncharacterized protein n=1 Tax=Albugo candida TaxID=65357 RepID=A0A024FTH6_9STRA|nr:unnamed protein product [Albugo candida]|eukprot:CCI10413.1 unnamed protein product [Albugo candida]